MPQVAGEDVIKFRVVADRVVDERQEVVQASAALLSERDFTGAPSGEVLLLGDEPSSSQLFGQSRAELGQPPLERLGRGPNVIDQGAVQVEDHGSNPTHCAESMRPSAIPGPGRSVSSREAGDARTWPC